MTDANGQEIHGVGFKDLCQVLTHIGTFGHDQVVGAPGGHVVA